jgi:hypothetical protein
MNRFSAPAVALAAILLTLVEGSPSRLPDVALDSTALFHVERVLALLGGATAVLVLVHRAARGELPTELSTQGVKYSADRADQAVTNEVVRLRERLGDLERRLPYPTEGDIE